jgi:hypothetical protein
MFRKTLIAATAVAAIATALVPATASAKGLKGGGWGKGWGYGAGLAIVGAGLAYSVACYQVVRTRNGDFIQVNVC